MRSRVRSLSAFVVWVVLLLPSFSAACSVCYGDPGDPMSKSLNTAIIALLAVTGTVLGGVGTFFVYLIRKARKWDNARGVRNPAEEMREQARD